MKLPRENQLLALLNQDIRADLSPISPVELHDGEVLSEASMPGLYGYFPITAVISLVSTMTSGASTEVALIGREGMVGLAGVLGTVQSPTAPVVRIAGTALRVPISTLRTARLRHVAVRRMLDLYTEARLIQVAQTAACSRLHSVEARLARWLLAIHDRIDGDEFRLPQELIGQMLGVQRPTVSGMLRRFRDRGVTTSRGRTLIIADRAGLERLACECHGVLHRELQRLLRQGGIDTEVLAPRPADLRSSRPAAQGETALETMREIAGRLLLANLREQEAREEAQAANHAKEQFLAMLSHELLDAAQLESGKLKLQPALVSLSEIVKRAVDAVMPIASDKQVALHLTLAGGDLPPMYLDVDRLRQAVLNVLTNALKCTDAGGSVEVQVGADGGSAHVTIHIDLPIRAEDQKAKRAG